MGHGRNSGFYREGGEKSQRKSPDLLFPQDPLGFCAVNLNEGEQAQMEGC